MKINLFNKEISLRKFRFSLLILDILVFGFVGTSYAEVVGLWCFDEGTGEVANEIGGKRKIAGLNITSAIAGKWRYVVGIYDSKELRGHINGKGT